MESFIQGLVFGFGAAVPVGPVNILIMSYALKSFKLGVGVGLGAMSVDAMYLILLNYGVLNFLNSPILMKILGVFGAVFLTYIAYLTFKSANSMIKAEKNLTSNSFFACYAKGFMLNLVNPYIIGFWLSVSSFVALSQSALLSLSGLIVAISLWIIALPLLISKSKHLISSNLAKWIAYICSILMFGFALMIVYDTFFKG